MVLFRLKYLHRHRFTFVRRDRSNYIFICAECEAHGFAGVRSISIQSFWSGFS